MSDSTDKGLEVDYTVDGAISEMGMSLEEVTNELDSRAAMDTTFDGGMIFNTECCDPYPLALKAHKMFMNRNMMKEQNQSVKGMEIEVIQMLSSVFGANDHSGHNGYVASCGTEANIVAFWAAKRKNPGRNKVIVPSHAHYAKIKLESILGLEVQQVPVGKDFKLDINLIEKLIDENTLGIIATTGTSLLGIIDPISELAKLKQKYDIHLHVDAAYGGFLIPFLRYKGYDLPDIGFKAGADSITLDPHKLGLCPLGAGVILFSDSSYIDAISYMADFPKFKSITLQGSRSGGPIASTWAMLKHLGMEGYGRLAQSHMEKVDYFMQKLKGLPEITYATKPTLTVLGLMYKGDDSMTSELHQYLTSKGFKITPGNDPCILRIIMHHHVKYNHIDNLFKHIKAGVAQLNNKYKRVAI